MQIGMGMSQSEYLFRVRESLLKDVGRAIARIDPKEMAELGIDIGDIAIVEGQRATPVRLLPCYPEERGKGLIQIDGMVRENAGTGIDEKVSLSKTSSRKALKVVLKPVGSSAFSIKGDDARYIGSLISGLPVMKGDRLKATLFGSRSVHYQVISTAPSGVVLLHTDTVIVLEEQKKPEGGSNIISYEDIGGLGAQVQRIREMIELPLKYPEIFDRLGVEPPKGVFLYGPPGTGKTLIVRAVARETDAWFINISGPEIIGKFYGESEARLRDIFAEAALHAPAIIFIDEIDAIAPRREEMGSEKQVEKRVVAQLLTLMDGLKSRGKVMVIGATNIPDSIDPALRRPGRFDREIAVSVPDRNGRLEIIHIHTRGIPLAEDVDLEKIADMTHGYVGADLESLAREAAMTALRMILPKIDFELSGIPYELLMQLEVTMDNFLEAMKEVEPSAIREFFVEVPNVRWDEVGGHEEIKQALKEAVEWPVKYRELFRKTGTKPSKGIILHGKPGTGKTWMAKALATESGVNFISVKGPEILSRFIGDSEKAVRELFRLAKQAAPTILFLDEIDSLAPVRGSDGTESGVTGRVISQFLTEMDGIEEMKGVFVLAATNRIDLLDPALLRPGRFDLICEVGLPDLHARNRIFAIHMKTMPLAGDVSIGLLAESTEGLTGAEIEFICRKARTQAMSDHIAKETDGIDIMTVDMVVSERHFMEAIRLVSSR